MASSLAFFTVVLLLGLPLVVQADNAKYSLDLTGIESGTGASVVPGIRAAWFTHSILTHCGRLLIISIPFE